MNNKVNYTLIGLITLVGFAFLMGFGYWLLKPTSQTDTKRYLIYFDESVLGLNIDAPVKYRGISVGKVSGLEIDPKNSEQVEVSIDVISSTPIKTSTLARLTAQGITGLTYINLSMGEQDSLLLEAREGEEYPIIKTEPSFFENVEKSFSDVSLQLSNTLQKTELLLHEKNQEEVTKILKRTTNILEKVDRTLDEKTLLHIQNTMANLDGITKKLDIMMPDMKTFVAKGIDWEEKTSASLESIMQSYLGIQETMKEVERAVTSGEFNLKEITADVIPALTNTLLELQNLMMGMEDVMDEHRRSPSDILYKQEMIKKGPGEK
ncbi:MAG: MlaD family protein [Sulfurimonadaceae bacterium]|jgi:phospholipid/cholesterol/gamma-HCH transport system substrate-binding protein|nr:MlaD family protein [Sulfurimonadaceae bacterium]